MPFYEEIAILTKLVGERQVIVGLEAESAAMRELGIKTTETGVAMATAGRRSFLFNQALFTLRRIAYGTTLTFIALGVEAIKLGFNFQSSMQQARVALTGTFSSTEALNNELNKLFNFTKRTPFQFKDVTIAFRQMYAGFRTLGLSADFTNSTLKALVDALSYAGRTTPGALNRVSVALQHMAFQGKVTGMAVNQLNRDGLPMTAALRKEFHLTGEEIHNIGKLGIPANLAMKALIRYINETPGFANAAAKQAASTLHGLFTTFKDNMMQLFGTLEQPLFHRIQGMFARFNQAMSTVSETSQRTHGNFDAVLKSFDKAVGAGGKVYFVVKQIIAIFSDLFKILGTIIGTIVHSTAVLAALVGILIFTRSVLELLVHTTWLWVPVLKIVIIYLVATRMYTMGLYVAYFVLGRMIRTLQLITKAYAATIRAITFLQILWTAATKGYVRGAGGQFIAMTRLQKAARSLYLAIAGLELVTIGWIAVILVVVAVLVILFFKWRWFHNLIISIWNWIKTHWPLLVAILTGPFGTAAYLVIKYWSKVKGWFTSFFGWFGKHVKKFFNWVSSPFKAAGHFLGFAGGGTTPWSGTFLVGERGPELVTLPQGAQITPNQLLPSVPMGHHTDQPIVVKVYLDGKVIAQAVTKQMTNKQARA